MPSGHQHWHHSTVSVQYQGARAVLSSIPIWENKDRRLCDIAQQSSHRLRHFTREVETNAFLEHSGNLFHVLAE